MDGVPLEITSGPFCAYDKRKLNAYRSALKDAAVVIANHEVHILRPQKNVSVIDNIEMALQMMRDGLVYRVMELSNTPLSGSSSTTPENTPGTKVE